MQISFDLPADPAAARSARATLEKLSGEVHRDVIDTAKLLVTELVTNSIRHCRTDEPGWRIGVNVEVRPESVYAEVRDPGHGFRIEGTPPSPLDVSGRGLFLVDQLATRWGVRDEPTSTVWFELPNAEVRQLA